MTLYQQLYTFALAAATPAAAMPAALLRHRQQACQQLCCNQHLHHGPLRCGLYTADRSSPAL